MVDKTARAVGRGCARQLALLAVAGTALLLFFGTALVVGWFVPLPVEWSVDRPVVVAIAMTVAASALVVASLVVSAAFVFRRVVWLDEAFAAVGLEGEAYQQSGRQYHGSWGGRRVDAYLSRGPNLDLYVESPLHTQVAVANRSAASVVARTILDIDLIACDAPGFEELEVHAHEPPWGRELLEDPEALELIPQLARDDLGPERRALIIGPEAIALKMRYVRVRDITPESVHAWVEGCAELARQAEDLPAPANPEEETRLDRLLRTGRGRIANRISCGFVTLVVLLVLAGFLAVPFLVRAALH